VSKKNKINFCGVRCVYKLNSIESIDLINLYEYMKTILQ
jgi:hypothetical protein